VVEPKLLLELLVGLFTNPPGLDRGSERLDGGIGRQVRHIVFLAPEGKEMARERIFLEHLLNQHSESIDALPHVGVAQRQMHLYASRNDHHGAISLLSTCARTISGSLPTGANDARLPDRWPPSRQAVAKLRQAATIENVDYRTARGLDRSLFQNLVTCQWIRDSNHLVIVGPTGTGKSWLACALGNKACRDGFSVLYKRTSRLFADLAQARGEGRPARLIAALERVNLLILDDWGPEPLTADQRRDLLEIVDDRYDKGSLLITSQVSVPQWHDVIADPTLGDAILDRIIHNAHRIELKGDSLRRQAGERKNHDRLAPDRPAGPQAPPARVAPSLVAALRAAHGPFPWTAGTISKPTRQP